MWKLPFEICGDESTVSLQKWTVVSHSDSGKTKIKRLGIVYSIVSQPE